jgi:hypothetical protein
MNHINIIFILRINVSIGCFNTNNIVINNHQIIKKRQKIVEGNPNTFNKRKRKINNKIK